MSYHKMIIHSFGNRSVNPQTLPQITDCRLLSRYFYTPFESCLLNLERNWLTERESYTKSTCFPDRGNIFFFLRGNGPWETWVTLMPFRQSSCPCMVHSQAFFSIKDFKSNSLGCSKNRTDEWQILCIPVQCLHKEIIYQKKIILTGESFFMFSLSLGMSIVYTCISQGSPTTVS